MNQITIVISLPTSLNRRKYIVKYLKKLDHQFEFLDATTPLDLQANQQNSAIAIWDSHIRAMKRFLDSEATNCLIFEDDVDLNKSARLKKNILSNLDQIMKILPTGYSIVQFGNMGFGRRNPFAVVLRNIYYLINRRYRFDGLAFIRLQSSIGIKQYRQFSRDLRKITGLRTKPLEGFVTGAQAYLLNRNAAKYLIKDYESRTDWDIASRASLDTYLELRSNSSGIPSEIRTIRLAKQIFQQRPVSSANNYYPVKNPT